MEFVGWLALAEPTEPSSPETSGHHVTTVQSMWLALVDPHLAEILVRNSATVILPLSLIALVGLWVSGSHDLAKNAASAAICSHMRHAH